MPPILYVLHPQTIDGVSGWRAAIHLTWESALNDNPLTDCLGAWFELELDDVDATAQIGLYTVLRLLEIQGLPYEVVNLTYDHDIITHRRNISADLGWVDNGPGHLTTLGMDL